MKSQQTVDFGRAPRPPRRRRGLVAQSDRWVAENWDALIAAAGPTLADRRPSPFIDLLTEALMQYASETSLLELAPPVVARSSEYEASRFGIFHPRTDRDAFIEALLGRPVPRSPRHRRDPPTTVARMTSPDALTATLGPIIPAMTHRPLKWRLAVAREPLRDTIQAALDDDRALATILLRLLDLSSQAFASTPIGVSLLSSKFDAIQRDAARPSFEWQFVTAAEVAPGVKIGIAWWDPADYRARRHRAAVAAHLRYLFDHDIAPWNRWFEVRTRREAAAVATRPRTMTVRQIADRLVVDHAADYAGELFDVTLARLFRISGQLRAWRRTALDTAAKS